MRHGYKQCRCNVSSNGYLLVCREMTGRNDRAIVDALEAMTHMMGQASQALQNQNGMEEEFRGLGKF